MSEKEINNLLKKLLSMGDKNSIKLMIDREKELIKVYKSSLKEIKSLIAAMYEKYGNKLTYAQMQSYGRLENLEQQIIEQIKLLTKTNKSIIKNGLTDLYKYNFYYSAYSYENSLGANLGFGELKKELIDAVMFNPFDRIKWSKRLLANADDYIRQIRGALAQGLITGQGYPKIAVELSHKTEIDYNKTARIIRTEGHRVQNAASEVSYKRFTAAADRLGIKTQKVWETAEDDRVRDSHIYMQGQVAINGSFTFRSGNTTEAPGLSGIAAEDINCRCTTISEVKIKGGEIERKIPETNYEDWYRRKIKKQPIKISA